MANQNMHQNSTDAVSESLSDLPSPSILLDRQWEIISNRFLALAHSLRHLADDSRFEKPANQNSDLFDNLKRQLSVSSYWQCTSPRCPQDCEACCETILKMYLECHLLNNERDNVVENFLAVWKIMCRTMFLRYIEQQMKNKTEAKKQSALQVPINDFPDDLQSLISDWDSLPENKTGSQLSLLGDEALQSIVANLTAPTTISLKDAREQLATQQRERGLTLSRPIRVIHPHQVKLTAQGLNNLKTINVRLGRVLPIHLTQKRSILQNRTNLPLVQNSAPSTGKIILGKNSSAGRGVKRPNSTSPLVIPRFPSLLGRANPTERMILTPQDAAGPHRPQLFNQSRPGRPPFLNHVVSRPVGATSLLSSPNVVSFHREFPPRQVPTPPKVAFIQFNPNGLSQNTSKGNP